MGKRSTKTRKVPETRQGSLLEVAPAAPRERPEQRVRFEQGDRSRLFVGAVPLGKYLEEEGLKWVNRLAALMDEFDWRAFCLLYTSDAADE